MYGMKVYKNGELVYEFWHSTMLGLIGMLNQLTQVDLDYDRILISYEGSYE